MIRRWLEVEIATFPNRLRRRVNLGLAGDRRARKEAKRLAQSGEGLLVGSERYRATADIRASMSYYHEAAARDWEER